MRLYKYVLNKGNEFELKLNAKLNSNQTLVLMFSNADVCQVKKTIQCINSQLPDALLLGCSTSGQIHDQSLSDDSIVVVAMMLEKTTIKKVSTSDTSSSASFESGQTIAEQLSQPDLKYVLLLSKGLNVNGSQLAAGVRSGLEKQVIVTGGLAGDNDRFNETWAINQENQCDDNAISAIGFYGDDFHVSFSSQGGWQPIGPYRIITASNENTLISLDGEPALSVYAKYLGELAAELPASGLLFPLAIFDQENGHDPQVRTILSVDEEQQSIVFAGDMPKGTKVRLMHASYDRLVSGASEAGESLSTNDASKDESFCLMISCVGRRLVLGQRTEEEVDEVVANLPENCLHAGFYSYGELTPSSFGNCELHNQTMTLTLVWET
jgi:hypothetical protein